jgi:uncharacterized protein YggE
VSLSTRSAPRLRRISAAVLLTGLCTGLTAATPAFAAETGRVTHTAPSESTAMTAQQTQQSQQSTVEVTGEGHVTAKPDVAYVNVGVEATKSTTEEAYNAAGAAAAKVLAALKASGVAAKDIRTDQVWVNPQYVPNEYPKISGYQAGTSVRATVRKIDNASKVLDAAVKAGGDASRVNGVSFGLEDNADEIAAARTAAYREAEGKAKQYAALSGRKLGKPTTIVETSAPSLGAEKGQMDAPAAPPMAASTPVPVEPGTLEVRVSVRVVFELV